jgi:outer membrane receptor protein involved in Fe transport
VGSRSASAQDLAMAKPRFIATWVAAGEPNDASGLSILQRRVTLELNRVPLAVALRRATSQARLDLSYDKAILPAGRRVSLHAQQLTLVSALTEILLQTGLDVAVGRTGQLALVRKPEAATADSGSIAGRVTDKATGQPIVGAMVALDGTSGSATSDEEGKYRILDVPAGSYVLRVRYIGYRPAMSPVTVGANTEVTADIALEKSAQKLDEVVSTGTVLPTEVRALPTPVTVITPEEIAERHPHSLAEVIRQAVPTAVGFDLPDQPYTTNFSVRGASALSGGGAMKVFVDGIEASQPGYSPVDPSSIERIEVVRGPQAATIYGPDAAGGVVQIFTKHGDPALERPQIDAAAALGVAQTPYDGVGGVLRQEYSGSVRGGAGDVGYNFGGSYFHLANYLPADEISRQSSPSIYGGMHFARGILTADVSARYMHHESASALNPLIMTTGLARYSKPQYTPLTSVNETYGARLTVAPTGWLRNQLTFGVDRSTLNTTQSRPRLTTPDDTLLSLFENGYRKVSIAYNASASGTVGPGIVGTLSAGVDHYDWSGGNFSTSRALNASGTIATSPSDSIRISRTDVKNTGVFAQLQVGLRDAVYLTAGLRADDNSNFGDELGTPLLPRVGLSVVRQVGEATVKARAAYGEAFRAPQFGASTGLVTATSITLSNPSLAPEQQQGWDAGVDVMFGDRWSLSVSGYDQTARDLIAFVQLGTDPLPTYQYLNVGRVKNRGIEVEGALTFTGVQLRAQYGYTQSRIDELGAAAGGTLEVGDQPEKVPSHTAGGSLTVTPAGGTTLTGGLTYVGSYRRYDGLASLRCSGGTGPCQANPRDYYVMYPGFVKLNATVSQRLTRQIEGFLTVDNLTNSGEYEGYSLAAVMGRITMAGLHVTY